MSSLRRWLRYHLSLGVCHIFVHVEDTPELLPLLASEEFADVVTVTTGNDNSLDTHNPTSSDNYYTLMQRQERQVRRSVKECRAAQIDWLFHVDDDELLYFDVPLSRIIDSLAPGVTCVVLVNIEAVPKALNAECVFEVFIGGVPPPRATPNRGIRSPPPAYADPYAHATCYSEPPRSHGARRVAQDIKVFTQHKMLAYRNGKSAGKCNDADWHGPHRFTGNYHVVPVSKACVLHFESCLYEQWRNKFLKHRDIEEQKKKDIPFPFYRDSISLFQVPLLSLHSRPLLCNRPLPHE